MNKYLKSKKIQFCNISFDWFDFTIETNEQLNEHILVFSLFMLRF